MDRVSFESLLCSKATIWNVTESTAFGVTESTSFSAQVDCRFRKPRANEIISGSRETNIGIYLCDINSDIAITPKYKMISEGTIYRVIDITPHYGKTGIHHQVIEAQVIK